MKKNPITRVMCLLLAALFCAGAMVLPTAAASSSGGQSAAENQIESMQKYLDSESYAVYYDKYVEQSGYSSGNREYTATFLDTQSGSKLLTTEEEWKLAVSNKPEQELDPEDFRPQSVYSPSSGSTSFTVTIDVDTDPEDGRYDGGAGMYYIVIEYYNTRETINAIERKLYIDNKMPFSEAASFTMSKTWKYDYLTGDAVTGLETDRANGIITQEQYDAMIDAAKQEDAFFKSDMDKYGQAGFRHDIIKNDLTPLVNEVSMWKTYICSDSNGYSHDYYQFYLSEGTHTITFDAIREGVVFGAVKLVPAASSHYANYDIPSFEEYQARVFDAVGRREDLVLDVPAAEVETQMIPAELPDFVSDSSVSMTNNKNSCITYPSSPSFDKYNVIGANSYNSVGQWAAYEFTPTWTGYYHINMRYLQNVLDGMFISRAVKITSHGEGKYVYGIGDTPTVPFTEAYSTRFNYSKKWNVAPLTDGTNDFKFFFEKDVKYTIYFEVSLGALANELQRVEASLEKLNECYLQILRITGPDPDENTYYGFEEIIPETLIDLCEQAVELQEVRDNFAEICGVKQASHLATMDNIIRQVAKMGSDEEEVAKGLAELKSSLGTLGTWISSSKASTLIVDYITIGAPEAKLGRANANIFQTIWHEIRAFFASFFAQYDMMGVTNEDLADSNPLEVWLASGRDQSKIVRNMIDADFASFCETDTAYTSNQEIPVSLKLVTGGTLLPSILAGKGPDVYMGLDAASVMNYSIRNAIIPISSMADYDTVSAQFHKAAIDSIKLPVSDKNKTTEENMAYLQDKNIAEKDKWNVYGLPMTMSFAMMFYRTDFLVRQGIGVPQTWDELLALLPTLRDNNMDIGMNYTLALDFFLYQMDGNMWKYTDDPAFAGAEIGLGEDVGLRAFDYCAKLYTDYSFPIYYDAANRFRTGEMPIVIQDYVGTYNQLIVFATEIEGLWSFSHIPGFAKEDEFGNEILDENGNRQINYKSMAGITAAVITSDGADRIDEAWQYMKWCTGAKYIADYSNRIVSLLGPSAKYASASREALKNMSWTSAEREAIEEQMDQLDTIINYPGSYYIGRNTNFAFLAAANNGEDPVSALQEYLKAINAEITRKREEFHLPTINDMKTPAGNS